jgi:hypothetical protein
MRILLRTLAFSAFLLLITYPAKLTADDHGSVVIVYKDGHRQTFAMNQISSIDFKTPAVVAYKDGRREKITAEIARIEFDTAGLGTTMPTRAHYIGKWQVGDGNGHTFFITLDDDGAARKTLGVPHGTWTLVDGEARIAWDDGWHDVIVKVASGKHEKRAFEPGKSLDDAPANVTEARNTQTKPI